MPRMERSSLNEVSCSDLFAIKISLSAFSFSHLGFLEGKNRKREIAGIVCSLYLLRPMPSSHSIRISETPSHPKIRIVGIETNAEKGWKVGHTG